MVFSIIEINYVGETVAQEILSNSRDDSNYDGTMNDLIDTEILHKRNDKEGNKMLLYVEMCYKILSMLEREEVNT